MKFCLILIKQIYFSFYQFRFRTASVYCETPYRIDFSFPSAWPPRRVLRDACILTPTLTPGGIQGAGCIHEETILQFFMNLRGTEPGTSLVDTSTDNTTIVTLTA